LKSTTWEQDRNLSLKSINLQKPSRLLSFLSASTIVLRVVFDPRVHYEKRLNSKEATSFQKGEKTVETAFVFINVKPSKEREVLEKLRKIKNVTESFELYGDYDIVVKVETEEKERLQAIIMQQIRGIKDIENTSTNYVFDPNYSSL
jgi:DNA-binding Lrp family transcriptional regulator